jgi:nucleotide-binding universal stress UspA family protein
LNKKPSLIQNRFKKILVTLDGSANSTRGLNEAISLARQSQGIITGLHVLPQFPKAHAHKTRPIRQQLAKNAQLYMDRAKLSAARHGIEFVPKVAKSDNIANTIVGYAQKNRFDVIVIGSRGMSAPHATFLGSVANGVVNISKIPVLIVK